MLIPTFLHKLKTTAYLSPLVFLLASCSGGSGGGGSDVEVQPSTSSTNTSFVYSGPTPASQEIQNFKRTFYDNLVIEGRCGDCHTTGGSGSTLFVDRENINFAWREALSVVNLSDPGNSAVVSRVASGHNCWLGDGLEASCAATLTSYIERWAASRTDSSNLGALLGGLFYLAKLDDSENASSILLPRTPYTVGDSKQLPSTLADVAALGPPTVDLTASGELLDLLSTYCSNCHSDTAAIPQSPYFASTDIDVAYTALAGRIDIENPSNSRLVLRLQQDFHNCWDNCVDNATEMEEAVARFASVIPSVTVDSRLLISLSQNIIRDGIIASSGGRFEDNIIAKWEFREGTGASVADTSGIQPELPLTLSGDYEWLGGWGVRFSGGKAQGGTSGSSKLSNLITQTGEYSIEAWLAPNNVTQEDAWIAGYSGGNASRNVLFTQTMYNYDFYNRSNVSLGDGSGGPLMSTSDDDELAQATLQHVVLNYDPINGRRIFVNGIDSGVVDEQGGGLLTGWNDSYALTLGNSVGFNRDWLGAIRMVAIHNNVLTPEQIELNNTIGVGQKYFLLFSVSELIDQEGNCHITDGADRTNYCYIGFEVSEYDDSSYLFNQPFFVNLNPDPSALSVNIQGMSLGINGKLANVGQSFVNINTTIDSADFTGLGLQLSSQGTIIPKENGPAVDEFFLAFESFSGATNTLPAESVTPYSITLTGDEQSSDIAFRTFDAINASFAHITGVSTASDVPSAVTGKTIPEVFNALREQLPSVSDFQAYFSSHQMAITQLAAAYCDALVQDNGLRSSMFPGFNFSSNVATIDGATFGNEIVDPLLDTALNTGLFTVDPASAAKTGMRSAIINLYADDQDNKPYQYDGSNYVSNADGKRDGLRYCDYEPDGVEDTCTAERTYEVVKAACTAVLASAAFQIN